MSDYHSHCRFGEVVAREHVRKPATRAGEQNGAAPQASQSASERGVAETAEVDRGEYTERGRAQGPSEAVLSRRVASPPPSERSEKSHVTAPPAAAAPPANVGEMVKELEETAKFCDGIDMRIFADLSRRAAALLSQSQPAGCCPKCGGTSPFNWCDDKDCPLQPAKPELGGNSRAQFEAWISAPPFERGTLRFGPDDTSWPCGYVEYYTQVAWDAWQAARLLSKPKPSAQVWDDFSQPAKPEPGGDGTPKVDALARMVVDATPFPLGAVQEYEAIPAKDARDLERAVRLLSSQNVGAEEDAARYRWIKKQAGYWQDGSQTIVGLVQDDATRTCFIKVGSKYYGADG